MTPTNPPSVSLARVQPASAWGLLRGFAAAIGDAACDAAYGSPWPTPSWVRASGIYAARDAAGTLVGWGALTPDEGDKAVWLSTGVLAAAQRRGYRHAIRDALCAIARVRGARYAKIGVFQRNREHHIRCHAEAWRGGPWRFVAELGPPFEYALFVRTLE